MPVYTAELYPTAIRNAGVGACNVAGGIALIIVPYLSMLVNLTTKNFQKKIEEFHVELTVSQNKIQPHYLMSILSAWSIFGGAIVVFLPETMTKSVEEPEEER